MLIVKDQQALRDTVRKWKRKGEKLALVPTMGNLHEGHLQLVREAHRYADRIVVSIFVNPTQFDRMEDLQAYPRTFAADVQKLKAEQVDVLFAPSVDIMYPNAQQQPDRVEMTQVVVPDYVMNCLEGASRSGHFTGVATVVTKLFNLVQPDIAVFGEKDYQQLLVIKHMVTDLNMPIEIIGLPTVREADGLAMSSRNGYLKPAERVFANGLYRTLKMVATILENGGVDFQGLQQEAMKLLQKRGFRPEYVEIREAERLQPASWDDKALVILAAAWLGKARLIDNLVLNLKKVA